MRLACEDDRGRGESLLPTTFVCGVSPLSVPQSTPWSLSRRLAAHGAVPALHYDEDSSDYVYFRGSVARP
jgi:hypothetical protein